LRENYAIDPKQKVGTKRSKLFKFVISTQADISFTRFNLNTLAQQKKNAMQMHVVWSML